jgi:hypothetical protein
MVFGGAKQKLADDGVQRQLEAWAAPILNNPGGVVADIAAQLRADPGAAQQACIERKQIWEAALASIPAPPAHKTAWGPCDGRGGEAGVEPDRSVSLVLVEPRQHPWMQAVLHNVAHVYGGSGAQLFIFHGTQNLQFVEGIIAGWTGVQLRCVGTDNFSIRDYDDLLTSPSFYDAFDTSHVLVFQTDVLLRRRVPAKFLRFDYVGAPWPKLPPPHDPEHAHNGLKCVGNGGFSLRRVLAMRELCQRCSWRQKADESLAGQARDEDGSFANKRVKADTPNSYFVDEDVFLTARTPADRLPPNHEAAEFCVENLWHSNPCGLHKAWTSGMAGDAWFSSEDLRWLLKVVSGADTSADARPRADPQPYEVRLVERRAEDEPSSSVWALVPVSA